MKIFSAIRIHDEAGCVSALAVSSSSARLDAYIHGLWLTVKSELSDDPDVELETHTANEDGNEVTTYRYQSGDDYFLFAQIELADLLA